MAIFNSYVSLPEGIGLVVETTDCEKTFGFYRFLSIYWRKFGFRMDNLTIPKKGFFSMFRAGP